MNYSDNQYITTQDLLFQGVLNDIKKSKLALQPIFECFTNAIEAIKIRSQQNKGFKGEITIAINALNTTTETTEFSSLTIEDNGIGFDEKEFRRFNTFKDFTKGFKNLGSGRVQYAHYFENTTVKSIFAQDGKYYEREFVVSKKDTFLKHNAIVFHKHCKETTSAYTGTKITFSALLENSNIYNDLNDATLKDALLQRYIHYFCCNKETLPKITVEFYVQKQLISQSSIVKSDIPVIDKEESISLAYSALSADGKTIQKLEKTQSFVTHAYKVPQSILKGNDLKLVSKGEIIEESNVILQSLAESDKIKGHRYLFIVSSEYIDLRDTNIRGVLNIPDRDAFTKNTNLFSQEEILIEDIQEGVNRTIGTMYPEIEEVKNKHEDQLKQLQEMFLLDDSLVQELDISINDTESKILEKFYAAEAKKAANIDATIKESLDKLDSLDTTSEEYGNELQKEIERLVKVIPLQNKTSLTHYVARRKLVLELFDKILRRQLTIQNDGSRNKDEKLLHNLIFQQTNTNPEDSDLWLVNEDFIYFDGTSDKLLKDIQVNGETLLRENLSAEEEEFRTSLNENRFAKKADILLFPEEAKCIIIEFKNPDVNVSDHLMQINNYASLIWNFSKPQFRFDTFYGYLIGEKINAIDVRTHDGDFKEAYHFDYLFRPNKSIPGFFVAGDASLYTEVIKYSTLLERAKKRNDIFIRKLTQ